MHRPIGRLRLFYPTLGSTNDLARALAEAGYPHGTTVVADYQSAGRGRQGRPWEAPPGSALLCSVLLRPELPAAHAPFLTMAAALAAAEAVTAVGGVPAALKWPNDVLLPAALTPALSQREREPDSGPSLRKVAGLLLETTMAGPTISAAIVGIGINISAHPPHLATATDIQAATGRTIRRETLLDALLTALQVQFEPVRRGDTAATFAAWRARLVTLGQVVQVTTTAGSFTALAEDVAPDGTLLVRTSDGSRQRLQTGDVTLSHDQLGA